MILRRRKKVFRPPAVARRVRELEIITARLIRAGFAGEYHAAFHGHGIEFAQVREYQPGDDIRTIDWNVTARSGVPHVKEFVEERDLTVLLAVDTSRSMEFGSVDRRKIDLAGELMAIFAYAAEQNGDRVGLLTFSDRTERYLEPHRGRVHVQTLVREALLAAGRTSGAADFDAAADFIRRVLVKRSVLIFISDFLDAGFQKPLRNLNGRHDVIALSIVDPREERFPRRGLVRLIDAENRQGVTIDLRRNEVERLSARRAQRNAAMFRQIGVDAVSLSTVLPYDRTLLRFFERRILRSS